VSAIAAQEPRLNDEITTRECRLIDFDGNQMGVYPTAQAQRIADDMNLDLVEIAPNAEPPVCRIMDYGKFKFEQSKREKEAKKNQHVVEVKEVRMSPGIDIGDFNTKLRNAQKFLGEGNRVKVTVRFRGREMAHTDIGKKLLLDFAAQTIVKVQLKEENQQNLKAVSAMQVSVTDNNGNYAAGKTDTAGQIIVPSQNNGVTNADGKVAVLAELTFMIG